MHYLVTHDGIESTTTYDPTGRFGDNATWVIVEERNPQSEWLIDIGPFMDRFGNAKMAVLTSANVIVGAILKDMFARKYLDLRREDLVTALATIGGIVPSVTEELQTAILTVPVSIEEQRALVKLYFS